MSKLELVSSYLKALQDKICSELSELDGSQFEEDQWQHKSGGGGAQGCWRMASLSKKVELIFLM